MSNLIPNDSYKIMSFEDTVSSLAEALSESKYSVWIYFKAGDLEIDTRRRDGNFFMSCNNKKNGSHKANSFSVSLAYSPNINTENVNYIDEKIWGTNKEIMDNTISSTSQSGAALKDCILQYGYNNLNVSSPRYEGKLLDYTVEIQNGMLMYTLTGYSSVVENSEDKHEYKQRGKLVSHNEQVIEIDPDRPTEAVRDAFKEYINGYEIEIDKSALNKDMPTVIGGLSDKTVFEYADVVLASAKDDTREDEDMGKKSIYYYVISDIQGQKKISIKRLDPKTKPEVKADIIFDWMGGFGNNTNIKTGSLVINFTTEFKGSIALAAMSNINKAIREDVESYSIDSYGNLESAKTFIGDAYTGDYIKSDAADFMAQWTKATNYSYKATLQTVGLPCDIPIGEFIKVRPLIYGRPHYTSGIYMIINTEDNVDSTGFTTTMNLIRIANL